MIPGRITSTCTPRAQKKQPSPPVRAHPARPARAVLNEPCPPPCFPGRGSGYPCDMKDVWPALVGLLAMSFIFLCVKIGTAAVCIVNRGMPIKIANIVATAVTWVFLLACWALYVSKALGTYVRGDYSYIAQLLGIATYGVSSDDTLTVTLSPGPGLGLAITIWVLLTIQILMAGMAFMMPDSSADPMAAELYNTPQLTQQVVITPAVVPGGGYPQGGYPQGGYPTPVGSGDGEGSASQSLEYLKQLLDQGLLTPDEYATKKAAILDRL